MDQPGRYLTRYRDRHEAWQIPAADDSWDALLAWCPPGARRDGSKLLFVWRGQTWEGGPGDWVIQDLSVPEASLLRWEIERDAVFHRTRWKHWKKDW